MSSDLHNYGIIGFTSDNVGIDRRIYTGLTSTDPVLNVSYNGGRVDVYLNGIKLVGDHSEMPSGTRDYTFTQTGQGSSIQLRTGVALVSADVVECIGHVSGSGKTVNTYTPSVSAGNNTFNSSTTGMNGFTLDGSDLLNVYLNGVLLDSSDYTSDASTDSVTITSLASGDVVHIQVIGALDYANFVPAGGGTFTGDVSFGDNNITNVGDIAVDTISSDAGTSIGVTLGTDAGDDFNVGSGKLVVEGDTGNVGIGTTSPSRQFTVENTIANSGGVIGLTSSDSSTSGTCGIIHFGNSTDSSLASINGIANGATDAGALLFKTEASGGAIEERMRLTDSGITLSSTSDGPLLQIVKSGTTQGKFELRSSFSTLTMGSLGTGITGTSTHSIMPSVNNARVNNQVDLGDSNYKYKEIYATNGTINTSDRNEKQDIEELSDAEQRVAIACKGLLRKFRWKSAIKEKGDDARIHFGIIAQDLKSAFEAEGLDAGRYGMFISTTSWAIEETYTDEHGVEQTRFEHYDTKEKAPEGATEKTIMGVRYSELLAFIISAI